jgi:tetratricopeptide (TPR) repeat protein
MLGEFEEALDSFDHALLIDENESITFIDKGDTFKAMGNDKEAMECYSEACKVMKKRFYED